MTGRLNVFRGGLRLAGSKDLSNGQPAVPAAIPARLVLPLQQHIGEPAEPVVKPGQRVLKGEVVAAPAGYVSVPVHASTSGTVIDIGEYPIPHPSGLKSLCVVLEADGEDAWCERRAVDDFMSLDPSHLRNLIRDGGIVGMGGAGFPTFIKLNPGPDRRIATVILNGAECEPYITCDDRLMRERPEEIMAGARIIRHAVQAERCVIGIEDDKPEAYHALTQVATDGIEVLQVPPVDPMGGEKELIQVITGHEVPSDGLPAEVGVVVQNVATAAAVHRAVERGEPLISRYVTVTGGGVRQPRNLEARIGTSLRGLFEECGLSEDSATTLIMGGPMMGFELQEVDVPLVKTSNCLLADTVRQPDAEFPPLPCIRCGSCARVCPVRLLPQQLYWYARAKDFDKVQDYHLFDCIECGCCAYVCPSRIPLVQYYRFAKTEIWDQERERDRADLARRRHEARLARLEREKREREARHQAKRAAVAGKGKEAEAAKQAAISAALGRAQAKRSHAMDQEADSAKRRPTD